MAAIGVQLAFSTGAGGGGGGSSLLERAQTYCTSTPEASQTGGRICTSIQRIPQRWGRAADILFLDFLFVQCQLF
jgi:hypothetical protein